jgi:adenylate kinase family enzyme
MVTQLIFNTQMRNNLLFCIFIRGLPGAGKSSLSSVLSTNFKAEVLDPDKLILPSNEKPPKDERLKTFRYRRLLEKCVNCLNKSTNIIWEQPWRKIINIKKTVDMITNVSTTSTEKIEFLVVEISINKLTSWERSKNKFGNRSQFEEFVNKYQDYNLNLPYLKLDGTKSVPEIMLETIVWIQSFSSNKKI